ncbi:MAG: succinylglutamate desuccinylase/aspartoacylase family protein [Bdellovibrionales bacterium]
MIIGGTTIKPGERKIVNIDVASLYDYTKLSIPVEIIRGKEPGPILFISAAMHGDEINGTEIIKRILNRKIYKNLKGTLIAVPIVNVFGFNTRSRYLPDRRDLNRSFPGSKNGSLAGRLAHLFMKEIVKKCTHGIDLHTGALNRTNLPQIRACLDDAETLSIAKEFGVPVLLHSQLRDGSLREAARKKDIPMLLFEGGEALRFEEEVIRAGVRGCLSVMKKIGMIPSAKISSSSKPKNFISRGSYWVRAPHSGTFSLKKKIGAHVADSSLLAVISDPFGRNKHEVRANEGGIIIGMSTIPLVNKGEAMFHIATFKDSKGVKRALDVFDEDLMS